MDPVYFDYEEHVSPNAAGVYTCESPGYDMFDYDASNSIENVRYGGVPCGYSPAVHEQMPAGYMTNMYQTHACDPMVYATNSQPHAPQYGSVAPTLFQSGFTLGESMPAAYDFQGPGGVALQQGFLGNGIAANQADIHFQSFHNNGGRQVSTQSRHLPHPPANAKFASLGPNMVDEYLPPDYSMNGWTWSGVEQETAPGLYPTTNFDGFGIPPTPSSQLQQYFPPGSRNQLENFGLGSWSKRPRSRNKVGPSGKRGIQKASHLKHNVPSRLGISNTSPDQTWREKKKKKTQPFVTETEPLIEVTEPVYYITWNGIDEECEGLKQKCPLCDRKLSYVTSEEDDFEYDDASEPFKVSDVAVLPCGHAFHSDCLQLCTPEDQLRDPPCSLCCSLAS